MYAAPGTTDFIKACKTDSEGKVVEGENKDKIMNDYYCLVKKTPHPYVLSLSYIT